MTAISSATGAPAPLPSTTTAAPAPAGPVASGATPGLTQSAVSIAGDEGVIATFSGAGPSSVLTYTPAGLLNAFVDAGTSAAATAGADSAGPTTPESTEDQSLLGGLSAGAASAGALTGSLVGATDTATPGDIDTEWASVLQSNPGLASTVAADTTAQGIVGNLSLLA